MIQSRGSFSLWRVALDNINKVLLLLVSFLLGVVLTGSAAMIRGDFLGSEAAQEVKQDLNDRMDREFSYIRQELREIKETLLNRENR